ncbi:MAG: class II fructose-bisphosphate aldolase [Armatimonadetes bacterium]|nr:class II fructose-bisphosphate aldolase [Armatimonadota bacterium]
MPLVTDYRQVLEVYDEARERRVVLPIFCCEDRETLEAILAAALEVGREIGINDLPIIPGWTARNPGRAQMRMLTACGDPMVGMRMMFSDIEVFMGETSPYRKLRVMPHMDHAIPWLESDIMQGFADRFASIMCDASAKPFEENIRLTSEFADKVRGKVVVEGAVDEVSDKDIEGSEIIFTSVPQAERFLKETGVDILVPCVGTAHHAIKEKAEYSSERAREISSGVGNILCVHGGSSLGPEDIAGLSDDGVIKITVFTRLAVSGGQAVARTVIDNLADMLMESEMRRLISDGFLGDRVLEAKSIGPKLRSLANPQRRDAWFGAVRSKCVRYLRELGYRRFE